MYSLSSCQACRQGCIREAAGIALSVVWGSVTGGMTFSEAFLEAIRGRLHVLNWMPTSVNYSTGSGNTAEIEVVGPWTVDDDNRDMIIFSFDGDWPDADFTPIGEQNFTLARMMAPALPWMVVWDEKKIRRRSF